LQSLLFEHVEGRREERFLAALSQERGEKASCVPALSYYELWSERLRLGGGSTCPDEDQRSFEEEGPGPEDPPRAESILQL
jgi:hypothetical protein